MGRDIADNLFHEGGFQDVESRLGVKGEGRVRGMVGTGSLMSLEARSLKARCVCEQGKEKDATKKPLLRAVSRCA